MPRTQEQKAKAHAYYLANKAHYQEQSHASYLRNKKKVLAKGKIRRQREDVKIKGRAATRNWRERNKERRAAYQAARTASGESAEYQRKWLAARPGYGAARVKRYRERQKAKDPVAYSRKVKKMNDAADKGRRRELARKYHHEGMRNPVFVVVKRLRTRLHCEIRFRARKCKKITSVMNLVGCTREELVAWLELQFKPGMSWENRTEWHIDHIRPVSSFDMLDLEEQKKCFHFTNLQPLWKLENLVKSHKIIEFAA